VVDVSPFQQTRQLIGEIDEYLDKVSEAVMVLEQTVVHFVDQGPDAYLEEKLEQIREIEARGDALRRSVANVMFSQMLLPDARSDVLALLSELDNVLDDASHGVMTLAMERPELPESTHVQFTSITVEAAKAAQAMVRAARAYFKEPNAIRDHTHEISFHEKEATALALRLGRQIFESDLSLDHKQQLRDWLVQLRDIASHADDVGDLVTIFGVKRAL
jgi:hypothetical protein